MRWFWRNWRDLARIITVVGSGIIVMLLYNSLQANKRAADSGVAIANDVKRILCEGTVEDCKLDEAVKRLESKIDTSARLTNCLLLAHGQLIDGGVISEEDRIKCQQVVEEEMNPTPAPTSSQNTSTSHSTSQSQKTNTEQGNPEEPDIVEQTIQRIINIISPF